METYAIATALTVLGNGRASRSGGLRIHNSGGDSWHRGCDNGGGGGRLGGSLADGCGDGIALVDHGGLRRTVLDGVASWESAEVYCVTG